MLKDLTPAKPAGLYSSHVSISPSPTVPETAIVRLMPYPACTPQNLPRNPNPSFQPSSSVPFSGTSLRLRQPCRKRSPRYIGPFPIQRQMILQLTPRYRIHHSFHISLLKPFSPSAPGPTEPETPPPPEILDQPSVYQVRDILDLRRRGGRLEYLIDWNGYGPEDRSWVARDDVLDPTLLTEFHHPRAARYIVSASISRYAHLQ